ncbi:Rsm22-domain-containing protein [Trametopsis cervina]|nr:Rsm22-domain-containing protein [Trametopsis cervina]
MSLAVRSQVPNARLELDPSFKDFIQSSEGMASWKATIDRHSTGSDVLRHPPRELEVYPNDPLETDDYLTSEQLDSQEISEEKHGRKSPAARFGSRSHGTIVLPSELQGSITRLISGSDKSMLHVDAKRLFTDNNGEEPQWDSAYEVKYKSRRQAQQHAERDGTAFASVALPSHYSAIVAVLDHVKHRLGPSWTAEHVIDWGSGTGSGLWAAAHVFQKVPPSDTLEEVIEPQISNSTIMTYLGLDKRDGLVTIGRRLLEGINLGETAITWKPTLKESHKRPSTDGNGSLAISAFMLSSLQTPLARKALVMEMWESGADTIVIIDHSTVAGFECIAEARASLLRIGQKQLDSVENSAGAGCHVVAPCPHDKACPLHHAGPKSLVCGFSQRLQRPEFVRRTKNSGQGHEDAGYSYVVIRKGPRPPAVGSKHGRIGDVGRRELQKIAEKDKTMIELTVDGEQQPKPVTPLDVADADNAANQDVVVDLGVEIPSHELQTALRSEAYYWPRLVFPPLKKNGHIILDSCTTEGKIMRMTIPKSQGKQPFYDARKSSWGDIFPHEPKNRPHEKFSPQHEGENPSPKDRDRPARSRHDDKRHKSYTRLAEDLNEHKKKIRHQKLLFAREGRM